MARTTSPRKHRPHGKPPSAGATSTQSSGLRKFERSEQRQRIERPHRTPNPSWTVDDDLVLVAHYGVQGPRPVRPAPFDHAYGLWQDRRTVAGCCPHRAIRGKKSAATEKGVLCHLRSPNVKSSARRC